MFFSKIALESTYTVLLDFDLFRTPSLEEKERSVLIWCVPKNRGLELYILPRETLMEQVFNIN